MIGYKLLALRKDGSLGPLFINRSQRLGVGVTYEAEDHPTKGYAHRPGWHILAKPEAPHQEGKGMGEGAFQSLRTALETREPRRLVVHC